MNWGIVIFLLIVALFFFLPKLRQVSVAEAVKLLRKGAVLIDVRSTGEHQSDSIPGSLNIPLNDLARQIESEHIKKDDPILVFCQSGMRSQYALRQLRTLGYAKVANLGSIHRARKVWMMSQAQQGGNHNG